MRYGFFGTPQFAANILKALIEAGYKPSFIISQPDRPSGRGRKIVPPPVARMAAAHDIPCLQPRQLDEKWRQQVATYQVDLLLIIAFGMILPPPFLTLTPQGCINLHTSLLPRWRGAAPIARAIENGDSTSGISIMKVNERLDAGNILLQKECSIEEKDTAGALSQKMHPLAVEALLTFLRAPARFRGQAQDESLACYAAKISKQECQLDWRENAQLLVRRVRAFNPSPGCFTFIKGARVKIWHAIAEPAQSVEKPGTVLSQGEFKVCCGQGILNIKEIQFPGRKITPVHSLNKPLPSFIEFPAGKI